VLQRHCSDRKRRGWRIVRWSHASRHTSHVTRHTSHVTRHTSHVTPAQACTLYTSPILLCGCGCISPILNCICMQKGKLVTRARHMSCIRHLSSHVARHTSHVTLHASHFRCHTSHVIRYTSHVTDTSHDTLLWLSLQIRSLQWCGRLLIACHTSHVTRHTSHVTRHTLHCYAAVGWPPPLQHPH